MKWIRDRAPGRVGYNRTADLPHSGRQQVMLNILSLGRVRCTGTSYLWRAARHSLSCTVTALRRERHSMDLAYTGTDAIPAFTRNCITATQICSTDGIASTTYGRGFCRNHLSLDIYIGRPHRRRIQRRVMRPRLGGTPAVSIAAGSGTRHPAGRTAPHRASRATRARGGARSARLFTSMRAKRLCLRWRAAMIHRGPPAP